MLKRNLGFVIDSLVPRSPYIDVIRRNVYREGE